MSEQVKTLRFETGFRGAYMIVCAAVAFACAALALISFRYLFGVEFIPPVVASNLFLKPWLLIHVAGAATALLIGPVQFSSTLRVRFTAVHRWIGRTYVVASLVGGVAGFILALGASTGPITRIGFGSLGILWILTTSLAWRRAMQGRFIEHRAWMITVVCFGVCSGDIALIPAGDRSPTLAVR